MRFFRKVENVCQNCIHGNNEKGKWIKRRFRYNHEKGWWNIFCERKERFQQWDKYKHCFEKKEFKN